MTHDLHQSSEHQQPTMSLAERRRGARAAAIGTALEHYDYAVYGLSSAVILGPLFFPAENEAISTALGLSTFGIAALVRPIGALLLGRLGDRIGRKPVLILTLLLMGFTTTAVGLLPTYQQAGVIAPILLITLRVGQGLGAGAEQTSATVASSEFAPRNQRGYFTSWTFASIAGGVALASGTVALITSLPEDDLNSWGWRLPFLAGGLIFATSYYLRRRVGETPAFTEITQRGKKESAPFRRAIRHNPKVLLLAMGTRLGENGAGNIAQLSFAGAVIAAGSTAKWAALSFAIAAAISALGGCLFIGRMCDRFGPRTICMVGLGGMVLIAIPALVAIDTGNKILIVVAYILSYTCAYMVANTAFGVWSARLFPAEVRSTSASIAREVPMSITGFVPTFAAFLVAQTGEQQWPLAAVMILLGSVGLLCATNLPEADSSDSTPPPSRLGGI